MQHQNDDHHKDPKAPKVQDPNRPDQRDGNRQQDQQGGHRRQDNANETPPRQR